MKTYKSKKWKEVDNIYVNFSTWTLKEFKEKLLKKIPDGISDDDVLIKLRLYSSCMHDDCYGDCNAEFDILVNEKE